MAARPSSSFVSRRGAFGASLALHGAVAMAAVLPMLAREPIRPASPHGVEVSWASPAAVATDGAEAGPMAAAGPPAEAAETLAAAEPEQLAAVAPPLPLPMPGPPEVQPTPQRAEPPPPEPIASAEEAIPAPPPPAPPPVQAAAPEAAPAPPRPVQRAEAPPRPRPARPAPSRTHEGGGAPGAAFAAASPPGPAAPAPAAAPPGPVLVTTPRYRRPPTPPVYPPRAVEFGLTGTVLVRARVGPDGSTEETRVWRSSGHALLDAAAVAAVRRWAFEPASVDGRRVEAWVEVPVHFRLN
jgi:protein TonB